MREFLFRAWDPLRNKMWKYAVPMFEGKINVSDRENGTFNEIIEGEIMQWTGLVDCKGNKIFDGDLLKVRNWEKILTVAFDWGAFFVNRATLLYSVANEATVVGNRFQNPELIKE